MDAHGNAVITRWRAGLQARQRARLDVKVQMLRQFGFELPPRLLAGPVRGHIYKLRINGDVALRPHLCKGPIDMSAEATLLVGAIERDRVLIPADAASRAEAARHAIIANHSRRSRYTWGLRGNGHA